MGQADAVARPLHGRHVADHDAGVVPLEAMADPGKDRVLGIAPLDPLEALGLAVAGMQRRLGAVERVEVADQALDAPVLGPEVDGIPVDLGLVVPLAPLPELAAMNRSFLPGWPHMNP